jgi:CrcB protein
MVIVTEVLAARRLLRPFVGVGILGGYTTFSTYVLDIHRAPPMVGLVYLFVSLVAALAAVWAGSALTWALVRPR